MAYDKEVPGLETWRYIPTEVKLVQIGLGNIEDVRKWLEYELTTPTLVETVYNRGGNILIEFYPRYKESVSVLVGDYILLGPDRSVISLNAEELSETFEKVEEKDVDNG